MVRVTFKGKTKDGKPKEREYRDADSFGVQNGDLVLVRGIKAPDGRIIGQNQYCFANGTWLTAEVVPSAIETPKNPFIPGDLPRGISRQ